MRPTQHSDTPVPNDWRIVGAQRMQRTNSGSMMHTPANYCQPWTTHACSGLSKTHQSPPL